MLDKSNWDWHGGEKQIDITCWRDDYQWVEEPYASPDGESVAAIVKVDDAQFTVCVNGRAWETSFDKIWHLRFTPDGRLFAIVSDMGEWTLAVDGQAWENKFGYVWNPLVSTDGHHIAVAVQQDMRYAMACDGQAWENNFDNITYFAISADSAHTAGAVQVQQSDSGEIHKFQEGTFSAALNGHAWQSTYVNVWNLAISPDGEHLAAEVRLNLYDYTIAVDGKTWDQTYGCVWAPSFHPSTGAVVAPVRTAGKWAMAMNGQIIWPRRFVQLWQQRFNSDGSTLAAIVAPEYGRWTVAVDGTPWGATFGQMVTDLTFSPDGDHVGALGKDGDQWRIVVDGRVWRIGCDMAWRPVFAPDGHTVAAKIQKGGRYTIAVNDRLWQQSCDMIWDPCFSADGKQVLIRSIEAGTYMRRIVPVSTITG